MSAPKRVMFPMEKLSEGLYFYWENDSSPGRYVHGQCEAVCHVSAPCINVGVNDNRTSVTASYMIASNEVKGSMRKFAVAAVPDLDHLVSRYIT